ncbi:uncharacterized protein LOC117104907 [Anneissia japonica]|uniref:uncharacterized protein LOC117104907 n=1 Tax=Anneissia japonica TaxID=1529436 RepID=UPI001425954A|nr:uncharacterized protein LOC117104907 [Anneissia japonica]XP_033101710.1 uncharacterized protein LOC117104907 [Anneissia japonica]XP_033101711.1 uncharacterized protein LOC117104907 [Anneissia japonica]XP_033101712.1 uncharacterized protein LOC117104907 [Anneissia japonica]XP_033101713.1 uncharacterized protein LOC117104907 [Anneissia japonica]XP_033101714.1 uncharacterized protein LOC117104907 [Anneissia japonica]
MKRFVQCSSPFKLMTLSMHTTPKMKMCFSPKRAVWERSSYKYFLPIQSRWSDNDQYGHVNNVIYYSYFDTIINHYLIKYCDLNVDLTETNMVGLMVETQCTFKQPVSFPEVVLAGLSVSKIGNSSVHYTIGLFAEKTQNKRESCFPFSSSFNGEDFFCHESEACAVGRCVHVFVDPATHKSICLPDKFRDSLERLHKTIDSKL